MTFFKTTREKDQKDLGNLHAQRARLSDRSLAVQVELAALRNISGEAILDEQLQDDNDAAARRAERRRREADLEAEYKDISAALKALVGRIVTAIIEVAKQRAAVRRAEADKLGKDLDRHEAETKRLQDALEAHAETIYGVLVPAAAPPGVPRQAVSWRLPKSVQMAQKIAGLRTQADQIERAAVYGIERTSIEAPDLDGLLLGTHDIEILAPTEGEIREWFAAVQQRPAAHWGTWNEQDYGLQPEGPRVYHLEFCRGVIDPIASKSIRAPREARLRVVAIQVPAAAQAALVEVPAGELGGEAA